MQKYSYESGILIIAIKAKSLSDREWQWRVMLLTLACAVLGRSYKILRCSDGVSFVRTLREA